MASRNIGTLSVDLILKSAGFVAGLDAASRAAKKKAGTIGQDFRKAGADLLKFATGAAAALAYMTKQTINAQDNFLKMSEATGASVEFLSQLAYTADQSGTSIESVSKKLVKLGVEAGNAAQEVNGKAAKAFRALGVEIKNTDGSIKNTETLFLDVVGALENYADGAEKTNIQQAIFGRGVADIAQLVGEGADGIRALNKEADDFGKTVTTKSAKAADQFNDNLAKLSTAVAGLVNQFTTAILPALTAFSEALIDDIKPGLEGSQEAVVNWSEVFLNVIAFTVDAVTTGFKVVGAAFESIGTRIGGATAIWVQVLKGNIAEAEAMAKEFDERASPFAALADDPNLDRWQRLLADTRQAMKDTADTAEDTGKTIKDNLIFEDPEAVKALEDYATALEGFADRFSTAEEKAAALRAELNLFRKDLSAGQIRTAEAAITEELEGGLEEIEVNIPKRISEPYKKAVDEMTQYTIQAKNNMQDALAGFLFDPFEDGLKGMLKNFVDTLRQMAANMAASQIFSFFGAGGGGRSFLENLFGGGRATGGPVMAGHAYTVGERGAETFIPSSNGRIVPNTGQPSVNITQNNYIEGSAIGPEQMANILNENNRKLKGEFLQELRRGTYS